MTFTDVHGVSSIELATGNGDDYSITEVIFTPTPAPLLTPPVLIDYVLTDSDGQSDAAQLAIHTPDQTITGTAGVDNIAAGALNDEITGDDGDDILFGNGGHDVISGGLGNDTIDGGTGQDYLSGGEGDDNITGGADADHLDGGTGDDLLDGGTGDDVVLGGDGNDQVYGGAGADRLEGGSGDDRLTGGAGADILKGDKGDDTLIFDGLDTLIDGGIDIDTLLIASNQTIDFGVLANDKIQNIEKIDLTSASVTLTNLSLQDVVDMTDAKNDLQIDGDAQDSVAFKATDGWQTTGAASGGYVTYTNSGDSTVLVKVDEDIPVTM